jgi:hypothetical protein
MNDTPADATAAGNRTGDASQDIVVFKLVDESRCRACGVKRKKRSFFRMEKRGIVCTACLGIDHLVFLPRGDTALTRRASKHSQLRAIVVRFSRRRRRDERQGILVEQAALERAKRECAADAPARERAREKAALRRAKEDERYVAEFAKHVGDLFPGCPVAERGAIAKRACQKYSGRIGRSAAALTFDPEVIAVAVRAHIRHNHTSYDQMLARGRARKNARSSVRKAVKEVAERWRTKASSK